MRLRFDRQLRNGENVQWQLGLRPIGPTTAKIALAKCCVTGISAVTGRPGRKPEDLGQPFENQWLKAVSG